MSSDEKELPAGSWDTVGHYSGYPLPFFLLCFKQSVPCEESYIIILILCLQLDPLVTPRFLHL